MATYAIGDVQGCLAPLQTLLKKIHYRPEEDTLWFSGDLANRGPQPLETLLFIHSLPRTICVLGNHDLSLLALDHGLILPKPKDTQQVVFSCADKTWLLDWIRHFPLLHHDSTLGFTLTHAGILPAWDLIQAAKLSKEVEAVLQSVHYREYLENMMGNKPTHWDEALTGWDRLRFITNAFVRMRFCMPDGGLELSLKGEHDPKGYHIPWFEFPGRKTQHEKLLFGHWSTLQGKFSTPDVFPLDSGCVWGNALSAFCLDTQTLTQVGCQR